MRTDGLIKAYNAGGAIGARLFVKPHSTAGQVVVAAAATDKIIGATTEIASASGDRVDVALTGIAEIIYGGTVAAGDLVTSDSAGKAVVAAPSAGVNNRIGGVALTAGVSGDYGSVLLQPGSLQGA
ncbi:MAG: DUF2190 family protein [Tildeniella torsiva UHER 1998/13D]|nr:DUF2190 family protein [Tildeniella torsiva UHER 1998/13D]